MEIRNIVIAIILLPTLSVSNARANSRALHYTTDNAMHAQESAPHTIRTASDVSVSLCIDAGDVTVTGWERNEVEARAGDANVEMRAGGATGNDSQPASSVEVVLRNGEADVDCARGGNSECNGTANIELKVPRGATIEINSRGGDVMVAQVAEAQIETISGRITAHGITRRTEAKNVSGAIHIEDARGMVTARTITGAIRVTNASASAENDSLELQSVSGEISLNRIAYGSVAAASVIGNMEATGALASEGRYSFQSSSGDITLNLPADSSFRLRARVLSAGSIVTDFHIRNDEARETSATSAAGRRLAGTHGSGAAQLNLVSHSGTISLRRR